VESERSCPRRLWQSIGSLLGRGRVPTTDSIDADSLHKFFVQKVDGVRTATADAPPPTFVPVRDGCSIDAFSLVTVDVVIAAVNALTNKQCASDPLPTSWLEGNDKFVPKITLTAHSTSKIRNILTKLRRQYCGVLGKVLAPMSVNENTWIIHYCVVMK